MNAPGAKRVDVGSPWGPKVSGARHARERPRGGFFRRNPRKPRFKTEGPEGAAPRYCTGKTHENARNRRKMTPTELFGYGGRRKPQVSQRQRLIPTENRRETEGSEGRFAGLRSARRPSSTSGAATSRRATRGGEAPQSCRGEGVDADASPNLHQRKRAKAHADLHSRSSWRRATGEQIDNSCIALPPPVRILARSALTFGARGVRRFPAPAAVRRPPPGALLPPSNLV